VRRTFSRLAPSFTLQNLDSGRDTADSGQNPGESV